MAAPLPAYARKAQVAPDSSGSAGSYATPSNETKADISLKAENIDVTDLNQSDGNRKRVQTLKDASGTIAGNVDAADTAQTTLRNGWKNRTPVWMKLFIDATNYFEVQMNVDSMDFSLDPAAVSTFTCSLSLNGTGTSPLVYGP